MFTTFRNGSLTPTTHRLSSLMDQFFNDVSIERPAGSTLPLAVWDESDKFTVEVDAPGISQEALDLSLHDGVLTIRAERKAAREDAAYDNRRYGAWEQSIRVPKTVDPNGVSANLAHGVLTVTIAKLPEAQPRKIPVTAQIGQ